MSAVHEPLFASTRDALRFALNYHLSLPRPQMNKMMADGKVMRIELADGSKVTVAAPKASPRSEQLRGLDGAATAGMVLAHLARLTDPQQLVLMAASVPPSFPCACGAPCCSGHKSNNDWKRAVWKICEYLRDEAQLTKIPGKKGLSTSPQLRELLVQRFFNPKNGMTLENLAAIGGCTEQTVIAHRRPIITFLQREQDGAWRNLDVSLSESGMVGHIR